MITREIAAPFHDIIKLTFEVTDLFYSICRTFKSQLQVGMLIDGTITKLCKSDIIFTLDCDIETTIYSDNILENKQPHDSLADYFYNNMPLKARVLQLKFLQNILVSVSEPTVTLSGLAPEKLAMIELSLKESEINNHKKYLLKLYPNIKANFKTLPEEYSMQTKYVKRPATFKTRRIRHPLFRNITEKEAIEMLASRPNGSVYPSYTTNLILTPLSLVHIQTAS